MLAALSIVALLAGVATYSAVDHESSSNQTTAGTREAVATVEQTLVQRGG
jgi:hypothetical protein